MNRTLIAILMSFFVLLVISNANAGVNEISRTGPSSNRVDIVFLGDGYAQADIDSGVYRAHVDAMIDHMFYDNEEPFQRYRNYFNIFSVNTVSNESGADIPADGIYRDTALDASYSWAGGPDRLLYVSDSKANQARNDALLGTGITADMQFVTVNETRYGGGGGSYAVYAGGNSSAPEIALHEVGHSFSGLADEYFYDGLTYTGPEPSQPNVTISSTGDKWSQWIGYDQPGIGTIGAYEGGMYADYGIYRPSLNSKMRALGNPFDAVSREQIILDIYDLVNPLDDWRDNTTGLTMDLTNPESLWVTAIDPSVIDLQWYVDDVLVAGANGNTFDLTDYGYGLGSYSIAARAFDPTDWVRRSNYQLEQDVDWSVSIVPVPGAALLGVLGLSVAGYRLRRHA